MKRTIITTLLGFIISGSINAQLLVDINGNVGIKYDNGSTVNSFFSIGCPGDTNVCSYLQSNQSSHDIGLRVMKKDAVSTNHNYTQGILGTVKQNFNSNRLAYGVYGQAHKEYGADSNKGRSFGVYGLGGNATSGWNYGVLGTLYGNNNGAGVYGSSDNFDSGMDTEDRYAGFFHGKVKATNAMYASAFYVTSDYRSKENIESIDAGSIEDIMKLNVVRYNLKQYVVDTGDTTTVPVYYYTEDPGLLQKSHYGIIAQELQAIYPDLVYESGDGYLSVNYMEFIPLLIKTIQDLKLEIEVLKDNTDKAMPRNEGTTNNSNILSSAYLYQNNPNPFTENTTVKCLIPKEVSSAVLYIYDMNGRQIDSRTVAERGEISLTIEGGSLDAGIYLYSLITDGSIIDTKRMILTN